MLFVILPRLFCSRSFLCLSSWCLSNRSLSLICLRCILASLASTLWLCAFFCISLSLSSFLVSLISLTLFQAFCNSCAASIQNYFYAILCIIICRNNEVDILRIRVGINNTENRNTKAVSLFHCNCFLHYIYDKEGAWQTGQVSDRTEVLLQLSTLTSNLKKLTLREVTVSTIIHQLVDVRHFLYGLADCWEVGEHTTWPALDNIWHIYAGSLLSYHVLCLFFSSDEQNFLAALGNLFQCISSLVNLSYCFMQVDDVNTVTLGIDVWSHCWIPFTAQVTKVAASLQQHIKICS